MLTNNFQTGFAPTYMSFKVRSCFSLFEDIKPKLTSRFNTFTLGALFMSFISESRNSMKLRMVRYTHYFKVFWRVVKLVFVNMMNNLISFKFSSYNFLHNISVLTNEFFINRDTKIPMNNTTCTIFSSKSFNWISMLLKPLIMHPTITNTMNRPFTNRAFFSRTVFIKPEWYVCHNHNVPNILSYSNIELTC